MDSLASQRPQARPGLCFLSSWPFHALLPTSYSTCAAPHALQGCVPQSPVRHVRRLTEIRCMPACLQHTHVGTVLCNYTFWRPLCRQPAVRLGWRRLGRLGRCASDSRLLSWWRCTAALLATRVSACCGSPVVLAARFSSHGCHRLSRFCGAETSEACNHVATSQGVARRVGQCRQVRQQPVDASAASTAADCRSTAPVRHLYTYGVCARATASRPRPADAAQQQNSRLDVIQYLFRCGPVPN